MLPNKCLCSTSIYRCNCYSVQLLLRGLHLPRPPRSPSQRCITIQPHFKRPNHPLTIQLGHQWTSLLFQCYDPSFRSQHFSYESRFRSLREEQQCTSSSWSSCRTGRPRPWCRCLAEVDRKRRCYWQLGGSLPSQHCWWEPASHLCRHACSIRGSIRCRVSLLLRPSLCALANSSPRYWFFEKP